MQNQDDFLKRFETRGMGLGLIGGVLVFIIAASGHFLLLLWLAPTFSQARDAFWVISEMNFVIATVPFWLAGALYIGHVAGARYATARRTLKANSELALERVWGFGLIAGAAFALLALGWSIWLTLDLRIFLVVTLRDFCRWKI